MLGGQAFASYWKMGLFLWTHRELGQTLQQGRGALVSNLDSFPLSFSAASHSMMVLLLSVLLFT